MKIQSSKFKIQNLDLKITKILLYAICYLLFAICYLLFANKTNAQSMSLGIYPPIFQIDSIAPTEIENKIYIENFGDNVLEINILLKAFTNTSNLSGEAKLLDDTSSFPDPQLSQKIKFFDGTNEIKSFTLSPKQKKNIIMKINLPPNQPKGDYYFSVIFNSLPTNQEFSNSSYQTGAIATNVLLTVGPKGKTSAIIDKFSVPLFIDQGPVAFNLSVNNISNHFITPKGNILITNMFGQLIGNVELLPVNILANSTRNIPDSLQTGENSKKYAQIKKTIDDNKYPVAVWPEKFLFGLYKATLDLNIEDNGPTFKRTVYFFAFPLTYLLAIIIVILITVFIVIRVKKKLN